MANYSEVRKHRGVMYCYEDNLFQRYAKRNEKIYVKCDNFGCRAVGTISGSNFVLNRTHSDHSDMKEQIAQLLLAEKIRKR